MGRLHRRAKKQASRSDLQGSDGRRYAADSVHTNAFLSEIDQGGRAGNLPLDGCDKANNCGKRWSEAMNAIRRVQLTILGAAVFVLLAGTVSSYGQEQAPYISRAARES